MKRGEIRWYTFRLPDKRRPVLVLTRNDVIDRLNEIIVVPATRTIRGLTTEVVLTPDDGMPAACALNFDHVSLAQRNRIGAVLGSLPETRWSEVQRALLIAANSGPRLSARVVRPLRLRQEWRFPQNYLPPGLVTNDQVASQIVGVRR